MTDKLHGGTWNMERDRDRERAAREAFDLIDDHDLDFLCIQECADYLHTLRELATGHSDPAREYDVIAFRTDPGRAESAIIVRASLKNGPGYQRRATRSGWFTVRGGKTPPKYLTTVLVAGWLRVVSLHTAPSVRWQRGRIIGPIRRVVSMRQMARSVVRFVLRRQAQSLLIAGDWNATPDARGRWSPHWICRKAGMRIAAPAQGTHGRRVIDFALIRGCAAKATREQLRGSDHRPVLFTVTR